MEITQGETGGYRHRCLEPSLPGAGPTATSAARQPDFTGAHREYTMYLLLSLEQYDCSHSARQFLCTTAAACCCYRRLSSDPLCGALQLLRLPFLGPGELQLPI